MMGGARNAAFNWGSVRLPMKKITGAERVETKSVIMRIRLAWPS